MSIHIQRFIDRLLGSEARGVKDFTMPIADAKGLHSDITRLLLDLQNLREETSKKETDDVITVQINGGSFK
jgi:hypothetical protein